MFTPLVCKILAKETQHFCSNLLSVSICKMLSPVPSPNVVPRNMPDTMLGLDGWVSSSGPKLLIILIRFLPLQNMFAIHCFASYVTNFRWPLFSLSLISAFAASFLAFSSASLNFNFKPALPPRLILGASTNAVGCGCGGSNANVS